MNINPQERKGENKYSRRAWELICEEPILREVSCNTVAKTIGGVCKATAHKMLKAHAAMVKHGVDPRDYTWLSAWRLYLTMQHKPRRV